jgi:hypothetical protein
MNIQRSLHIVILIVFLTALSGCGGGSFGGDWSGGTSAQIGSAEATNVAVSGSNVYVGTLYGLSISADGGSTWVTRTTADGLPCDNVMAVAVSGSTVYAACSEYTGNGPGPFGYILAVSTNGGRSWSAKDNSLFVTSPSLTT